MKRRGFVLRRRYETKTNSAPYWLLTIAVDAQFVAAHMPPPYLDKDGNSVVPRLTDFVLREFEAVGEVFDIFCEGVHYCQIYFGNIAQQHEAEGGLAEAFRTHPLRRVREWAERESSRAMREAKWWRERHEEDFDQ
jgi:hypothetical protein